jgi:hypothetical protein
MVQFFTGRGLLLLLCCLLASAAARAGSPPVITAQPPANLTLVAGNYYTLSLFVDFTSTDLATVTWRQNGTVLTDQSRMSIPSSSVYLYYFSPAANSDIGDYTATLTNSSGSVTSQVCHVNVEQPMTIAVRPTSVTVPTGATTTLQTTLSGGGTGISYQWYDYYGAVAGATLPSLTLTNIQQSDGYYVSVTDGTQTVKSSYTYVSIGNPPTITLQPNSVIAMPGQAVTLTVNASGTAPLQYQWYLNATPVAGATSSTLTWASASVAQSGSYYVVVSGTLGSVTSNTVTVSIGTAPVIATQPSPLTVASGQGAAFSVSAGTGVYSYQWYKNGSPIAGATGATLSLAAVSASDAATYYVVVSNALGSATSASVALTVNQGPVFTTQPAAVSAPLGGTVTLSAAATGQPAPSYQWFKNGQAIAGAVGPTLVLSSLMPAADALYAVSATNAVGSTTSANVHVTVVIPTRAVNLSTLARTDAGNNALIAGFVLSGSANKLVLVRAVGPTLATFGVAGSVPDPSLSIVNASGQTIAANDDWSTSSNLSDLTAATAATGAFALPPASKDASLLTSLPPGAYTAVVGFNGGAPGTALVEIYEADGPTLSHLSNLSSRATISRATPSVTTGLVVSGPASKQFLLRAVGPTLASFGVSNPLNDPKLILMDASGNPIASNDDWQTSSTATAVASATTAAGAFTLPPGSKDSALLVTLPPGSYTALTQASDGGYGTVLVEIYEVP